MFVNEKLSGSERDAVSLRRKDKPDQQSSLIRFTNEQLKSKIESRLNEFQARNAFFSSSIVLEI